MEKSFDIIHLCMNKGFDLNIFKPGADKSKTTITMKSLIHISTNLILVVYCLYDIIFNARKKLADKIILMCMCCGFASEMTLFIEFLFKKDTVEKTIEWIRGRYLTRSSQIIGKYAFDEFVKYRKMFRATIL